MYISNAIRWGLTTFTLGCASGIIGHYIVDNETAFILVVLLSALFGILGTFSIAEEGEK